MSAKNIVFPDRDYYDPKVISLLQSAQKLFGTQRNIAQTMGIARATMSEWKRRGKIPEYHIRHLKL
jgi:DNA invertase Pin-like site-specific DNA recombinase